MIEAVDLFCGAGGTSSGILKAARERLGRKIRLTAVNHWQTAINTHSLNHPEVKHICEPVENIHPMDHIKSGKLDLLAASCECRFHSNARGGGPCNEQSRSQPWQLIRWATDLQVDNIMMENVREFMNWGPLNRRTKRPLKSKKGEYFRAFVNSLASLGYSVEWRVQVCADYGDPTTRQRLILIATKGRSVPWPVPSHGAGRATPWLCARKNVIDWSLRGKSLFGDDGKPRLCENTVKRIYAGFEMQGAAAEPFLVLLRGTSEEQIRASHRSVDVPIPALTAGGGHVMLCEPFLVGAGGPTGAASPRSLDNPLNTIMTEDRKMLVEPFITAYHAGGRGDKRNYSVDKPLPTQDTSNRFALVEPFIVTTDQTGGNGRYARTVDAPLATVVTKQNMQLVEPFLIKYYGAGENVVATSEPLPTVTTADRFGLVSPVQEGVRFGILTRMLEPHELARAHSFPADYKFTGKKRDHVKQIGNSVPVNLAAAHAEAILKP